MSSLHLPPRLSAIAGYLRDGDRIADVGTDHGYLPIWAVQNLNRVSVIASDINPAPLKRAMEFAEKYAVRNNIDFILCAGLEAIAPERCDKIVIAGMGGETIAEILSAAPWTRDSGRSLILQPMTRQGALINWLASNGYEITGGRLVKDSGRIYQIITAAGGTASELEPIDLYAGYWLFERRDELLGEYLDLLEDKLCKLAKSLERSKKPEDAERLGKLLPAVDGLKKRRREVDF